MVRIPVPFEIWLNHFKSLAIPFSRLLVILRETSASSVVQNTEAECDLTTVPLVS
jgi:hypothetical protein